MMRGAARAGATVKASSAKGRWSERGRELNNTASDGDEHQSVDARLDKPKLVTSAVLTPAAQLQRAHIEEIVRRILDPANPAIADRMTVADLRGQRPNEAWPQGTLDNAGVGIHIAVRRIFEKLRLAFLRLRNALRGLGFRAPEDIFEGFARGDIGRRARRAEPAQDRGGVQQTALRFVRLKVSPARQPSRSLRLGQVNSRIRARPLPQGVPDHVPTLPQWRAFRLCRRFDVHAILHACIRLTTPATESVGLQQLGSAPLSEPTRAPVSTLVHLG